MFETKQEITEKLKKTTFSLNFKTAILVIAAVILSVFIGGTFNTSLAKDNKLPELKPMVPKLHKVEPYQAGVEHNQYIKKKKKVRKKKKPKRKRLKSSASSSKFKGKKLRNGRLDKGGLNSSIGSNMLESSSKRGIGIIGVKFEAYPGLPPVIKQIFSGTPASKAGLRPLDAIVAVDGIPTYGLRKEECYDLIVGTPNTPVTLSIRRGTSFSVYTMIRMDHLDLASPTVREAYGIDL